MPPAEQPIDGSLRVALELSMPSDVQAIEGVVAQVQRTCQAFHLPERHCALTIPVALTEAISNAILRGNRGRPDRQVQVRVGVDDGRLVFEVRDEGQGFDLDTAAGDPTAPENLLREDGRGIFLMKKLMDSVEQRHVAGGNVVRLTLRRQ